MYRNSSFVIAFLYVCALDHQTARDRTADVSDCEYLLGARSSEVLTTATAYGSVPLRGDQVVHDGRAVLQVKAVVRNGPPIGETVVHSQGKV